MAFLVEAASSYYLFSSTAYRRPDISPVEQSEFKRLRVMFAWRAKPSATTA
jgi:hypothetical protein